MQKGIIDSRYDLREELGRGGCGVVYHAVDRHTMRPVALKVLPQGVMNNITLARLAREARTAFAINHPNVCSTLDRGVLDDGRPYVAMELLHGETLREYLSRHTQLDEEEAIEITVQMLAGLEAAHALGVVHRDVKPENAFLVWEGRRPLIKLMDFGVCRRAEDPVDQQTLTLAGSVVGTPGYFAPEQLYGERAIDPRADLFAVGLVLFEMLTGHAAFSGKNPVELAAAGLEPVPAVRSSLASVSMLLDRIVAHATEQEPEARYPTAAMFQHDLLEARTALRRNGSHSPAARKAYRSSPEVVCDDAPTRRIAISPNMARRRKVA